MTPKEKAIALVDSYMGYTYPFNQENIGKEPHVYKAKQCALFAVDEIIDRLIWHTGASDLGNTVIVEDIKYWTEVKQEIEKL